MCVHVINLLNFNTQLPQLINYITSLNSWILQVRSFFSWCTCTPYSWDYREWFFSFSVVNVLSMVCIAWRASPAVLWFSLSAGFYAKLTFKYYFSPIRRLGVVIFRKVCAQISIALSRLSNTLYGTKYSRSTDKGTQAGHISARALAGRVTEIFFLLPYW